MRKFFMVIAALIVPSLLVLWSSGDSRKINDAMVSWGSRRR